MFIGKINPLFCSWLNFTRHAPFPGRSPIQILTTPDFAYLSVYKRGIAVISKSKTKGKYSPFISDTMLCLLLQGLLQKSLAKQIYPSIFPQNINMKKNMRSFQTIILIFFLNYNRYF